jgi:hypothetical protein
MQPRVLDWYVVKELLLDIINGGCCQVGCRLFVEGDLKNSLSKMPGKQSKRKAKKEVS